MNEFGGNSVLLHLKLSIESWLGYDNPQYIKGSVITYNHQPTVVLNTSQVFQQLDPGPAIRSFNEDPIRASRIA